MAGRSLTQEETLRWTRIGALSALALLLGYLETFVPIPIPGVKLGLANVAVLVALAAKDVRGAFFVGIVKVLATGLLFGNPVTLAYSALGTLLAFCCMAPLSALPTMRIEMVSVVGALAHEAGQLVVAQLLLGTSLVWYSAPILAIAGCATGAVCGTVAARVHALLGEGDGASREADEATDAPTAEVELTGGTLPLRLAPLALAWFAIVVVAALRTSTLAGAAVCVAASAAGCIAARTGIRRPMRALVPMAPIALLTVLAQVANAQQGQALLPCIVMLARLACISFASVALMALVGTRGLMSCAEAIARPLELLGVQTAGPRLAIEVALALVPSLASSAGLSEGSARHMWTRAFWREELPRQVQLLYAQAQGMAARM